MSADVPVTAAAFAGPAQPIDRDAAAAARADGANGGCGAPAHLLVVGPDLGLRACDYGACSLALPGGDLAAAWRSEPFDRLRREQESGRLPTPYCSGCALWVGESLTAAAPLIRDYGTLPPATDRSGPDTLVLHLPAEGKLTAAVCDGLTALLPQLSRLVIDCAATLGDRLDAGWLDAGWLDALRASDTPPTLTLRLRRTGAIDAIATALTGLAVDAIELTLDHPDADAIASCRELATRLDARARARLVLGPGNWFWFEDIARACAERSTDLDVRLLDRDGRAPLAALSPEQLAIVKDIVTSAWHRFADDRRPISLGERDFPRLGDEIRGLLGHRTQAALHGDASGDADGSFSLPDLDHPWCHDPERTPWWLEQLFGHSHLDVVRDWMTAVLLGPERVPALRQRAWLRVLLQKLAWENRSRDFLAALREVYGDAAAAARLRVDDAAFTAGFDATPFGGPWLDKLGLAPTAARKRPFPIGRARKAGAADTPRLTVLIPSYRHARFIKETIRSVLAQSATAIKVLVVDDRSPDDTVQVARSVKDPRLEVRINAANLGLGNSVLQALLTIDTPYVALLNSDDVFHPDRIKRCLEVLDERDDVQVVTTELALIDDAGGHLTPAGTSLGLDGLQIYNWVRWYADTNPPADLPRERLFEELLERNFLATSSNLTARTDWLRDNAAAFTNLKYCLDWQVFLAAALERSLYHIAEPLVGYRLHATNTVWFEDGSRWAFFLEVNRVIAEALGHYLSRQPEIDEELVFRVTNAVVTHVAANRETDGIALFLNTVMDALAVDRIAAGSERIQQLLQGLGRTAAATIAARNATARARAVDKLAPSRRVLLANLSRERATAEKLALQARESDLVRRLGQLTDSTERAEEQRQSSQQQLETARERAKALDDRCQSLAGDLEDLRHELRTTRETSRAEAAAARDELHSVRQRLGELQTNLTAARAAHAERLQQLEADLAAAGEELAASQQQLAVVSAQRKRLRGELQTLRQAHADLESALADKTAQVKIGERAINRLEKRRDDLVEQNVRLRTETETLARSREFRIGNFLWNKLPLSYMSRRGKKWYNRLIDAKDRVALWAGSRFKKSKAEGVAIVASVWQWPIYSHTFVYQEMIGFTHMGLDVKMFHWAMNDADQLQPAFSYLADHRLQLKPALPQHRKDKEYWDKARPGRLRALLERIASATGKSADELEEEPQVLRACTFAKMAELAGANYVHSYFFYDQSFMVMITAWLLEIPRGVSCYADHMLDDYPFKLVPLQLELADVVVATSARIKRELVEIGGEAVADKIVVKPNGVNGERFEVVDRGPRTPEDTFEVISISRLEPKKGLEYMIEAVADLKRRGRKIIVHIVGAVDASLQASITYGAELENQIKELGLEDEVILHGMMMQDRIKPLMDRCRAFVAPYVELESGDKDGIPTAMLEGLACSLPIVTTNAGSILEVVQDGVQALVAPQRDAKAYADNLDRLIGDPALEKRLSKAARARFDREFDTKVTERRLHERVAAALSRVPAVR